MTGPGDLGGHGRSGDGAAPESELDERVLEVFLERMFEDRSLEAGERSSSGPTCEQRTERILAAWKRGVTGTGLEALGIAVDEPGLSGLEPPRRDGEITSDEVPGGTYGGPSQHDSRTTPSEHPKARGDDPSADSRGNGLRVAAALLLAVGAAGALHWWQRGRPPAGPHLVAQAPVTLSGDSGPRKTRFVPVGVDFEVQGSASVRLASAGAAADWQIDAQPGAQMRWGGSSSAAGEGQAVELLEGDLEARTSSSRLELVAGEARWTIPPGVMLRASVRSETMEFAVESGRSVLDYAGLRHDVDAEEHRILPRDPASWLSERGAPVAALCNALLVRIDAVFPSLGPQAWLERNLSFHSTASELAERLDEDPLAWELVAERFEAVPDPAYGNERRLPRRQLSFLAWDRSPRAIALARRLWVESPQSFGEDHLVAFAASGVFEFERELRALLSESAAAPDTASASVGARGLLAAVYFAQRGDPVGRALLERFADPASAGIPRTLLDSMEVAMDALLASAALDWLGDRSAWEQLLPYLKDEVDAALELEVPRFAVMLISLAEHFAVERRDVLRSLPLGPAVAQRFQSLEGSVATTTRARDLLRDLAGRW